jgi:hypothetical protein
VRKEKKGKKRRKGKKKGLELIVKVDKRERKRR